MKLPKFSYRSATGAAVFLMATSAIGPGFLTQTAYFTNELKGGFGLVILVSILLDLIVQLNIWRILVAGQKRAPELVNDALPGAGSLLSILVIGGGLAFNIGNLAGTALGLNAFLDIPLRTAILINTAILLIILTGSSWLKKMDGFVIFLGVAMLVLTAIVAFEAQPPVKEAIVQSIHPASMDLFAILTLVGGTVGGYISFAGGHRLLDAGIKPSSVNKVSRSAMMGILLASVMRICLFLAAWGVVSRGIDLGMENPAAAVFQFVSGKTGYRIFGLVMWCAAMTSVIGASYTSISFAKSIHPILRQKERGFILIFILISALLYLFFGTPVKILVLAGSINGFILPLALGLMLWVVYRRTFTNRYRHPLWLGILGAIVVVATTWMAIRVIIGHT